MNFFLLTERKAVEDFMVLHNSHNYLSRNEPKVSGYFKIPTLTTIPLNGFLDMI